MKIITLWLALALLPISAHGDEEGPKVRHTVLVESTSWNAETNVLSLDNAGDLRWHRPNGERMNLLAPGDESGIKLLKTSKFEALSFDHLSRVKFSKTPIPQRDLQAGAVVAVRTAAGNFAKLKIVRHLTNDELTPKHTKDLAPTNPKSQIRIPKRRARSDGATEATHPKSKGIAYTGFSF